ncbi:MAG: hypothetical protein GC154_02035 [bacterium]|nr:hypothetical protein [bacterium]
METEGAPITIANQSKMNVSEHNIVIRFKFTESYRIQVLSPNEKRSYSRKRRTIDPSSTWSRLYTDRFQSYSHKKPPAHDA